MLMTQDQIKLFKQAIAENKINVVFFDLETSPSKFWGWGTGEQYVDASMLVEGSETKVITAQYLYAHEKKAQYFEWEYCDRNLVGKDENVVRNIINIINTADIVIGQNSKAFDMKVLQERAKILRLPPVSIDFMIDTLTSSRGSFKSMSHRLDYRSKQYGLGGKHKMEMRDWIDILNGKVKPLAKMIPYGLKDVLDTYTIFWRDLPYYNLPKATVNKILKLIAKVYEYKKFFCKRCAKNRKKRFEVTSTPISDKKTKILCLNCGLEETICL